MAECRVAVQRAVADGHLPARSTSRSTAAVRDLAAAQLKVRQGRQRARQASQTTFDYRLAERTVAAVREAASGLYSHSGHDHATVVGIGPASASASTGKCWRPAWSGRAG